MIPTGYDGNSILAYVVAAGVALMWLAVSAVCFSQWLGGAIKRMSLMTAWDWAELSGWLLVIGSLSAFDSYLIFFR